MKRKYTYNLNSFSEQSHAGDGTVRNNSVYKKISLELAERGFSRTIQQIKDKLKSLRSRYQKTIRANNKSGRPRKTCHFYEELDDLYGTKYIISPPI